MKKITLYALVFSTFLSAQISLTELNKLSNQQLDAIRQELGKDKTSTSISSSKNVESISPQDISLEPAVSQLNTTLFGYEYFNKSINFFDNIPTPDDYRLGPGDDIIISLWGENNSRETLSLNKEGLIYYENIGFINLTNKTLKESEEILRRELSNVYSTLNDKENPTELMLELGKIKSINVFFSGNVNNAGISLIHPFSDVFTALVQVGGVNPLGSLREVELIRNGKKILTADFYSFFLDGNKEFMSERIMDGDVIHVPNVGKRIQINGQVNRTGYFELINNENGNDLLKFAGNLTANAGSKVIYNSIVPMNMRVSDDFAKESKLVSTKNLPELDLNNGDSLFILEIKKVSTEVEILGRVKNPGKYPSSYLKNILDTAGGFNDPTYRKSIIEDKIVILRKNNSSFYNEEIITTYDNSEKVKLFPEDKILVYENKNYTNIFTIPVLGQVQNEGFIAFKDGMTINDAIKAAGGLTDLGDMNSIILSDSFKDSKGNDIFGNVVNIYPDTKLSINSSLRVLPKKDLVKVSGNVYSPGLLPFNGRGTVKGFIEMAGGMKPNTLKRKIYVKRNNGKVRKVGFLNGRFIPVENGDSIVVPLNETPKDFDLTALTSDIITILTNLVAITVIIDNNN